MSHLPSFPFELYSYKSKKRKKKDMKKLIISFLIFIPLQIVSGQDKIITIQNDTIYCRIVAFSPPFIQYEQKDENKKVVGKFIPTDQILEFYWISEQTANIQIPKPVKKHYLGLSITNGVGKYISINNSAWDQNYIGIGFEYFSRGNNLEVGTGLFVSSITSISVPFTVKQYFGKYIFIGSGVMAGYEKGLCVGVIAMIGVEYVFENGFSLSLSPNLRYSIINLTGIQNNYFSNTELLHAGVTFGIGFRF